MSANRIGKGRVLVAEDEAALRLVTLRVLNLSGYEAEGAEDGEIAWQALVRERFDPLITDHGMPRLSGLELLKRLRVARMDLPVILVSAMMPHQELDRHPWLCVQVRMQKPYSVTQLLDRVADLLPAEGTPSGVQTAPLSPANQSNPVIPWSSPPSSP